MNKSIVLLSGGLDSLVSLGVAKDEYNVVLALTFDYGQKSVIQELEASKKICDYYKIEHNVIELEWLMKITKTSLVSENTVPAGEELIDGISSMQKVWVPNRNGLFLNIAGSFADSQGYSHIIFGANLEEAQTFSDNTFEFLNRINMEFEYSTLAKPEVVAPLIAVNKSEIDKMASDYNVPLDFVRSCYLGDEGHCGTCESCVRLKNALIDNNKFDLVNKIFGV